MKKILGLDLSIQSTGLCVLDFDSFLNKDFKHISIKVDKEDFEDKTLTQEKIDIMKLICIEDKVREYLKEVDLVVIENYAFDSKFNRERLGELHGVIKRMVVKENIPFMLIDTHKLKLVLTGSSRNPTEMKVKQWILLETKNRYNIDFETNDDECDAFGLSLIGMCYKNPSVIENLNISQNIKDNLKEVINKIDQNKIDKVIKKKKRNLTYYQGLPYNVQCIVDNKRYITHLKHFDIFGEGTTLKKSISDLEKKKRSLMKEMKKNKKRITCPNTEKGIQSYIVRRNFS